MGAPKAKAEVTKTNPIANTHDWVMIMSPSGKKKFGWVSKK